MDALVKERTSKQMLYVSMISMVMMFAGLTSAYVISSKREDWVSLEMPQALYLSTAMILLSSITFILAKRSIKKDSRQQTTLYLILTLVLGIGFVASQIQGFYELREGGFYMAGEQSVVSSSLLMVISFAHLLHVAAGIIVLLVVVYKHLKQRYSSSNYLGLDLGAVFWHFVDILWIFLFLFFYFIR
ncbi:MAG: cytochrome c oxidase subunit 3 [Flavobacteriaceae bacterium]|nr:cytochrome c oxidase subunit 3 [Flavobacteriaceae bacterium]